MPFSIKVEKAAERSVELKVMPHPRPGSPHARVPTPIGGTRRRDRLYEDGKENVSGTVSDGGAGAVSSLLRPIDIAYDPQGDLSGLTFFRIVRAVLAGGYVLLLGIASSCMLAPGNHMDVLKTRCEEQVRCNSPLYLDRGVGVCFGQARSHPHAASRSPLLMTVSARCRLPKHGRKLTRLSLASAE